MIDQYPVETLAIAGIAGGNGLEHVDCAKIKTVYGLDINPEYLEACGKRFAHLGNGLVLLHADLSDETEPLPRTDLVIANLFIEYVGVEAFAGQVSKASPRFLSCVIQKNTDAGFVSESPYAKSFAGLAEIHRDIAEDELTGSLRRIGYDPIFTEEHVLPNGKKLLRLDYRHRAG